MAKITFRSKKDPSVEYGRRNEITKEDMQKKVLSELNEWQLCPKCNGTGIMYKIVMMSLGPMNSEISCDVCNGKKIISKVTGNPPE